MPIPDSIAELVTRFEASRKEYHQGYYNETQTRIDYVNPLFAALGWDMDNHEGLSELLREVVHEDSLKIGGTTKAPDYSFRTGGARKFFLETKKPSVSVDLKEEPAYQLRRYAWTAKLPVSILTNFEEFAVYDGRVPPDKKDSPKKARLDYFKFTDYLTRWDDLEARFSKDAVLSGAFDRYAEEAREKRLSLPVDAAFLAQISGWREKLASHILQKNAGLAPRELNYAVQMIIDRIIFLRISEDRGIEPTYLLQPLLNKGGPVYPHLLDIFRRADDRYNSGLFHLKPEKGRGDVDDVTPRLTLDDRPLREIIGSIYYPESPFEFSVFPADILGHVYEQFLGKVIHVSGKTATVEDKPEVKKAGGVYYTPTYIVDYIVQNTVGKLVAGKTPAQVAKLTILDPACGSGSFLIGAYQFLLDWHLRFYETDRKKWGRGKNATVYQSKIDPALGEVWRLTTAEKKRILLQNIYGVDIDTQAVEVTKLSLLLKVLEDESAELLDNTLKLYQERALPDLEANIKCGNSLIAPDFYADKALGDFDLDARLKINAFDWHKEFAAIMSGGGFDSVIGNPPYIRIQTMKEWSPWDVPFYKKTYASAGKGNYDIYVVFVEKGLSLLNKTGHLGFILPHKFFNSQYGQPLRKIISDGKHLESVVHFGDQQIFDEATTYTCLLFLNQSPCQQFTFIKAADLQAWRQSQTAAEIVLPETSSAAKDWNFSAGDGADVFSKLDRMPHKLRDIAARIGQGIRTSANEVYVLDLLSTDKDLAEVRSKQLGVVTEIEKKAVTPFLQGREIKRYAIVSPKKVAIVPYRMTRLRARLVTERAIKRKFPLTHSYLLKNKEYLEKREKGRFAGKSWYVFGRQQNIDLMLMPKILVPDIADKAAFALDEEGKYAFTSGYGITLAEGVGETQKYVLGLLNSRLLSFYLKRVTTPMRGGFFRYFTQFMEQLPIRRIDFTKPAEQAKHDQMVSLVDRMVTLHKDKAAVRLAREKAMVEQQIEETDAQIDRLVYDLYRLTDEEIAIMEGAG